jgi:hypothetical protein
MFVRPATAASSRRAAGPAQPERIEKLVTESQSRDATEMAKLARRGITPVVVPDNDPDHNPAAGMEDDLDQPDLFNVAAQ